MRLVDLIVTQRRVVEAYQNELPPGFSVSEEVTVRIPRGLFLEVEGLGNGLRLTVEEFILWAVLDVVREVADVSV